MCRRKRWRKTTTESVPEGVAPNKPTRSNSMFSTMSFNDLYTWYFKGRAPSAENFGPLADSSELSDIPEGGPSDSDFYYDKDAEAAVEQGSGRSLGRNASSESPIQF
jgi:hypothetical protein